MYILRNTKNNKSKAEKETYFTTENNVKLLNNNNHKQLFTNQQIFNNDHYYKKQTIFRRCLHWDNDESKQCVDIDPQEKLLKEIEDLCCSFQHLSISEQLNCFYSDEKNQNLVYNQYQDPVH